MAALDQMKNNLTAAEAVQGDPVEWSRAAE
jgi:hypothetical protein